MARPRQDRGSFRRKGAKQTIYWRGTLPRRTEEGVIKEPIERSCGTSDEAQARTFRDALIQEAYDALTKPVEQQTASVTFADLVKRYYDEGRGAGNERLFIRLARYMGDVPITGINQELMNETARTLFPGQKASSINRSLYTPVLSVLN